MELEGIQRTVEAWEKEAKKRKFIREKKKMDFCYGLCEYSEFVTSGVLSLMQVFGSQRLQRIHQERRRPEIYESPGHVGISIFCFLSSPQIRETNQKL